MHLATHSAGWFQYVNNQQSYTYSTMKWCRTANQNDFSLRIITKPDLYLTELKDAWLNIASQHKLYVMKS